MKAKQFFYCYIIPPVVALTTFYLSMNIFDNIIIGLLTSFALSMSVAYSIVMKGYGCENKPNT